MLNIAVNNVFTFQFAISNGVESLFWEIIQYK